MIWIYIAAAIFGGGFVLPALIGSLDFDTDADFDFDTDLDVDVDMDLDADSDLDADASQLQWAASATGWALCSHSVH